MLRQLWPNALLEEMDDMGTSRNDPSPPTHPWRMANAMLGRTDIEIGQQVEQMWRAAGADLGAYLEEGLTQPAILRASQLASERREPANAIDAFDDYAGEVKAAGLAVDAARRALGRAAASRGGAEGFAAEFFSEISAYYAARDLPSFIGAAERISSVSGAVRFKRHLREWVAERVSRAGVPPNEPNEWAGYVSGVVADLQAQPQP